MDLTLVSAGDDIKIWDPTNLVQLKQFNPHDQNINSLCWSPDNNFLASASVHTEDVVVTYMNNNETLKLPTSGGCLCVNVSDNSRYMLIGDSAGLISVWDLKAKKKKKTYKGHKGPVTSAKFNKASSYIASGSETGEIILHNVVTGQGCQPLTAPNVQAIKQVQYSYYKKSLLGAVSDDGSVNMWDCNKQQLVQSFNCHQAPTTGLSFSPINDIFLMSVGLDKRIACHDLTSKRVVKIMTAESPLTSIDTMGDGVTVVVGSTRGIIYQYDLRMTSVPVRSVEAHRSSVQCLQFQKEPAETTTNKSGVVSSSKQQSKHRQLPVSPKSNSTSRDMGGTSKVDIKVTNHGVTEDIFSPLREGFQDQSTEEMEYHGSFLRNSNTQSKNSSGDGYLGVFSPINDNIGRGSAGSASLSPLAYTGYPQTDSRNSTGLMDYNRMETQNIPPDEGNPGRKFDQYKLSSSNQNLNNSQHKQVTFMPGDTADPYAFLVNGSSSSSSDTTSPDLKRPRSANQQQIGMSASPSLPSMHQDDTPGSVPSSSRSVRHFKATTPDGVNPQSSIVNSLDEHSQENGESARHYQSVPVPGDMKQFAQVVRSVVQEELKAFKSDVRNVVRDEVDDMVDTLHKDIINLQAEMLRQFQIHQGEMLSLLEHYSVNRDLVSEVERLQDEVRRLKKNF